MPAEDPHRRATDLRKAIALLTAAAETLIEEWVASPQTETEGLPTRPGYEAERTVKAALGTIEELACNPGMRLMELGSAYLESRALHIAAKHRIPELVAANGDKGVHIDQLARSTGIEKGKLSRILRALASEHVFREVTPYYFANNRISEAYVGNKGLRAYTVLAGLHNFTAVDHLPYYLADPVAGASYEVSNTAFNRAIEADTPIFEWFDQKVPSSKVNAAYSRGYPGLEVAGIHESHKSSDSPQLGEEELIPRPEREIFHNAMIGAGNITGLPLVYDFPWQDLGSGTVVDVGSGVGQSVVLLHKAYSDLHFVLQDRPEVIDEAKKSWATDDPKALTTGQVQLMAHDFFQPNPVEHAKVYFLRNILHNWPDHAAIKILSNIAVSMGQESRILIADQVMNTTIGSEDLNSAPEPLLANYGYATAYSHRRSLIMMTLFNGIERTPAEFKVIIEAAGLKMTKIWECRGQINMVECRLPGPM
ncbi:S-adenosyl-L-methionine-dependent methyltransferase [Xylariales sp. PMI_506]|nr:S-adenosyl-L-methionine-dependent methyltransferase [Xylariales sp. PMI_506]